MEATLPTENFVLTACLRAQ